MKKVKVVQYEGTWPQMFDSEAAKLRHIFGDILIHIHHIGSTSIEGLQAKPIIDMMPVVKNIELVDQFDNDMTKIGYECCGEFGIKGRRYFRKGGVNRTHHIHIFQEDNKEAIDRHLAFRNYLRAHPMIAEEYGRLKMELANKYSTNIEAYMDGKDSFIKETEIKALQWQKEQEGI